MFEFLDADTLEVSVRKDPLCGYVFTLLKQLNAIDAMLDPALTVDHLLLADGVIDVGEAPHELFGKQLGADVAEKVDQRFRCGAHRAILLEVPEFNEILDLGLVEGKWHARKNLAHRVQTNGNVLILAVLRDVVVDDLLRNRLDLFRRYKLVARFDNHGEYLTDFVLLVRVEVPQNERVKLQDDQVVSADQARHKSKHVQFDLILVVGLLELAEEALGVILRVKERIDGQEVSSLHALVLASLLALLRLDGSLEVRLLLLRQL